MHFDTDHANHPYFRAVSYAKTTSNACCVLQSLSKKIAVETQRYMWHHLGYVVALVFTVDLPEHSVVYLVGSPLLGTWKKRWNGARRQHLFGQRE